MVEAENNRMTSLFFRGRHLPDEMSCLSEELVNHFYSTALNRFDYRACAQSKLYRQLQLMVSSLSDFDPASLETLDEQKAFWLNLYNLLVLYLIMLENVRYSVLELSRFFSSYHYQLKDIMVSLDDIEHGILRGNRPGYLKIFKPFKANNTLKAHIQTMDPRVHMALYCAAKSSSRFYNYTPAYLEQELNIATCVKLEQEVKISDKKLYLPKCFYWYKKDFGGKKGILDFVTRYHPNRDTADYIAQHRATLSINWQRFDWSINQK